MGSKRLDQYRSSLSLDQIAAGMNAARQNALRLVDDAKTLFDAGRVPTAVALAVLSIEESGKVPILRQMATCETDAEWRDAWKQYRSHTKKNIAWIMGQLVAGGARTLDGLRGIADLESDHPQILDDLKQLCLYTDCLGSAKWTTPAEISVLETAPYLLTMAKVMANLKETSVKELELWRANLLPVKGATFEAQKRAVSNWYRDMAHNGLSAAAEEKIESFLRPTSSH